MRVYRIQNDVNQYQYFLPAKEQDFAALRMSCKPLADKWRPPEVFIYKPLHKVGDFYQFNSSCLILRPRAAELLATHLEMAGELLPLPHGDTVYTLLNVLECINCLDTERTRWVERNGRRLHIEHYFFHPNRFSESAIFKIPMTHRTEVLVVERDSDEGFIADLKRFNILGYKLTLLWDSEAPTP